MRRQFTQVSKVVSACCLVLAVTVGGAAQLGVAVLCVGVDGHVDVEYTLAGCCTSSATPLNQMVAAAPRPETGSCGACVDLDITSPPLKDDKTQLSAARPVMESSVHPSPLGGYGTHGSIAVHRPHDHTGHRACLSTVVLLI